METTLDAFGGLTSVNAPATGRFNVGFQQGRWWLFTPEGNGFFSLALNHAEEADLKHPHNIDVWTERYGTRDRWREAVLQDMRTFGFNTLGWTQQWVAGDYEIDADWLNTIDLEHSAGWTSAELRGAGMPYVQTLRFAEFENWNGNPQYPDVFSRDFEDYATHLARTTAANHADDPNLIGYFFVDIPAWIPHASGRYFTRDGRHVSEGELADIAARYYEVTTAAVRSFDDQHLIMGDRYNGNKGIPDVVLEAAAPYLDVLSIQYFPGADEAAHRKMRDDLQRWHDLTGKPIINADAGNSCATALHPARWDSLADQSARGRNYEESLNALISAPWLIGWHWCGYVENPVRGWGIKSGLDEPYADFAPVVTEVNTSIYDRLLSTRV
ncbi:agarase [Arthrobacter sp. OAP107]|uniref:agarase n=1 Tax=Arthrobacter sp. OAP107 TaxID=3156445 RepID=UPI00339097B6